VRFVDIANSKFLPRSARVMQYRIAPYSHVILMKNLQRLTTQIKKVYECMCVCVDLGVCEIQKHLDNEE
jgi:hypothetical protein